MKGRRKNLSSRYWFWKKINNHRGLKGKRLKNKSDNTNKK